MIGRIGFLLLPLLGAASAFAAETRQAVEDVIPLTVGNMRGHRMLFDEGYYVVSSSKKALRYAKEHSIDSSGAAIRKAAREAASGTKKLPGALASDAASSAETGERILVSGTKRTGRVLENTRSAATEESHFAEENFQRAVDSFVRGNLAIVRRTKEDRAELAALPGGYYRNLRDDFSDIYEYTERARKEFAKRIGPVWEGSFEQASRDFQAGYERSGEQSNSLAALGPLLAGWARAIYHGLLKPAATGALKGGARAAGIAVVAPVAGTISVAGRTLQSFGLTVFYVGKTGVHVVSPTVEGGLFAGISLLSATAVPATVAGGVGLGAINQVACVAAAPTAAMGQAAASAGTDVAGYMGGVAFDAASGATQVTINQAKTGVVLGYNALTALPSHAAMGLADTAIFLAWDGPRLAVAAATGKIGSGGDEYSAADLPVGSVVDLKKLEQEGVKVETISTDPAAIKSVLEKLAGDLRAKEKKP